MQQLRVDSTGLQAMATRWGASVGEHGTEADALCVVNEARSANELVAVAESVTVV